MSKSKSDIISIFFRNRDTPEHPRSQDVAAAFKDKDLSALKSILEENPDAWKIELALMRHDYTIKYNGNCSQLAAYMGWATAMDLLKDAGDPLTLKHAERDVDPLHIAVSSGHPAVVRRLIGLGIKPAHSHLLALRSMVSQDRHLKSATLLVEAGADPWKKIKGKYIAVSLLENCSFYVSTFILGLTSAPAQVNEDEDQSVKKALTSLWLMTLNKGNHSSDIYLDAFNRIKNSNIEFGLTDLVQLLPKAERLGSAYPGIGSGHHELCLLLSHVLKSSSLDDLRLALPHLEKDQNTAELAASALDLLLEGSTQPAISGGRQGLRL